MGNISAEWCNVSFLRGAAVQYSVSFLCGAAVPVPRVSFLRGTAVPVPRVPFLRGAAVQFYPMTSDTLDSRLRGNDTIEDPSVGENHKPSQEKTINPLRRKP